MLSTGEPIVREAGCSVEQAGCEEQRLWNTGEKKMDREGCKKKMKKKYILKKVHSS